MAYVELNEKQIARCGRELADALELLRDEEKAQVEAKKAMTARIVSLTENVSKLKTIVRSGKAWVDEQASLEV